MTTEDDHQPDCTMCRAEVGHDHSGATAEDCPHGACAACGDLISGEIRTMVRNHDEVQRARDDMDREIAELYDDDGDVR